MAKKNFKSATEDIFGAYENPKTVAENNNTKDAQPKDEIDNYELFLLSVKNHYLEQLKEEANANNLEVNEVLEKVLSQYYNN